MSRRKIIQLPPPKFNSKRSEKWWLVAGDPASYWVNFGNFSGAKLATFNFGYPGIPMAKPWQSQVWLHRALLQDIHPEVSPARQAKGKKVGSLAPSTVTEVWNTVFCGVPFWGVKKWGDQISILVDLCGLSHEPQAHAVMFGVGFCSSIFFSTLRYVKVHIIWCCMLT